MHPIAERLQNIIKTKKTRLCLAADLTHSREILELAQEIAPYICVLKTHVDIIEDFSWGFIEELKELSRKHEFLIFEDRKFADIGNTVKLQAGKGMYKIFEWADIVNAHIIPGKGIIAGLKEAAKGKEVGLILIAQMSSNGNLMDEDYAKRAVAMAKASDDFTIGFIGNGSNQNEIKALRSLSGDDFLIFAPGVQINGGGDSLGQAYGNPRTIIDAGADVIIVGRGIYEADTPSAMAEEYRKAARIKT